MSELTPQEWNAKVIEHAPLFGAFLQSYEWGEFQSSIGREVRRVYVEKGGKEMIAQAIRMPLPVGRSYWMVPKGPLGTMNAKKALDELRQALGDAMFYRMEPPFETNLPTLGETQPSNTVIVDLEGTEDEILGRMKSKTRYNMRLAGRKGVESRFVTVEQGFEDFGRLMKQTATRDGIKSFSLQYYRSELEALENKVSENGAEFKLAMAFYEGRALAANVICDFAGMRTYVHGATSNLHRSVMPQYHLHHFLLMDAKEQGLTDFDFWGIAPEGAVNHKWSGITRYKLGFGGTIATVPQTVDLPIEHIWYGLYKILRSFRR